MKNTKNLSEFLKNSRVKSGLTQSDVAGKLGYSSPQFISNWERGIAAPPVPTLRRLADLYKVSSENMLNQFLSHMENTVRKEYFGKKSARN